jgi:hypothetical protein
MIRAAPAESVSAVAAVHTTKAANEPRMIARRPIRSEGRAPDERHGAVGDEVCEHGQPTAVGSVEKILARAGRSGAIMKAWKKMRNVAARTCRPLALRSSPPACPRSALQSCVSCATAVGGSTAQ